MTKLVMKLPTFLLPIGLLGLVAALPLAGCNRVPPPTESRLDPYAAPQVVLQSERLRKRTAVDAPRISRDGVSGNLLVTVPMRNTDDRLMTVDYYVTWLDEAGRPTSAGRVGPFTRVLPPSTPIMLTADAPTRDAADFIMDVRLAQ